jgi:hypothetical protein
MIAMKKKKNTKSKVNQVQTLRRALDVGELDQVYGGGGVLLTEGTKGGEELPSI